MYIYSSILYIYICGTIYGVFHIGGMGLQKDSVANCWLLTYLFPLLVIFIIIIEVPTVHETEEGLVVEKTQVIHYQKKPLNYFIIYCVYVKYMYVYIYIYTHTCADMIQHAMYSWYAP